MEKEPRQLKTVDKSESALSFSPEHLLSQAIEKGLPVETMEKLLAMRRELKTEWAKEQFDAAMAEFQAECPVIAKKKEGGKTKAGNVAYHYAPLDEIVKQTKAIIGKHGFSYLIKTEMFPAEIIVNCIVKHNSGHSEETNVKMPLANRTDIMSAPQQVAATVTFAKRYAFCNAFGILTGDEDSEKEMGKSGKEVPDVNEILSWQQKLESAESLEEAQSIWLQIPVVIQKELKQVKNQIKKKYENS